MSLSSLSTAAAPSWLPQLPSLAVHSRVDRNLHPEVEQSVGVWGEPADTSQPLTPPCPPPQLLLPAPN